MDQQFYYQQSNMQMNQMQQGGQKKKGDGVGFGVASMVLGILSLLFFCTGCNLLFIILAVIFGIIQLVKNEQKGFAITGLVTPDAATEFATMAMIMTIMMVSIMIMVKMAVIQTHRSIMASQKWNIR